MSEVFDRIYGRIEHRGLISELLDCPGLLRLMEIGMGNVRFINFPSLSAVTRYEHALGACHLARIASLSLGLPPKDSLEIQIAALYHDVTTPPFAHAMEEVLGGSSFFDHEKRFNDLIMGKSEDLGGPHAQVFQGRALKLPRVCQGVRARRLGIDLYRIPGLVFGKEDDNLSSLISGDIDLDNIDNVIRAGSALGIEDANRRLAESLAGSFVHVDGSISLTQPSRGLVDRWSRIREQLYDVILCSMEDFSLQTMLKHALRILVTSDDDEVRLTTDDWKLTETEMLERLGRHSESSRIIQRMKTLDLYKCFGVAWIKGPEALKYIERQDIQEKLERTSSEILGTPTVVNYYLDKRKRRIVRQFVFLDRTFEPAEGAQEDPAVLIGFFNPRSISLGETKTKGKVKPGATRELLLQEILGQLPSGMRLFRASMSRRSNYPHMRIMDEVT